MKTELYYKKKLNQKLPHTKITLHRNCPPTKNNDKPNTQVNRLSEGSTDAIKLHNKFSSLDTMDVDLDSSFDKQSKNKKVELHTSPPSLIMGKSTLLQWKYLRCKTNIDYVDLLIQRFNPLVLCLQETYIKMWIHHFWENIHFIIKLAM